MRRSNSKVRILLKTFNLNLTPMIIYPRSICTSFEFFPWDLNPTGLQKNIYTYRFWQMSTSALNCIDDGWRRERKKHRCEILHLIFHFESWFVCMYVVYFVVRPGICIFRLLGGFINTEIKWCSKFSIVLPNSKTVDGRLIKSWCSHMRHSSTLKMYK